MVDEKLLKYYRKVKYEPERKKTVLNVSRHNFPSKTAA
jgi:hypothetical protein